MPHYWPAIEAWVAEALSYGGPWQGFKAHDIKMALMERKMGLWVAEGDVVEGCAVTVLQDYPQGRVCLVIIVGGVAMKNWLHFDREIGHWAKKQGCAVMDGVGRRGWKRPLAKLGYVESLTHYRKVL